MESTIDEKKAKGLRAWNLSMGVLHLGQGIAMLALSTDFSLPVIGNFLNFNVKTQSLQPTTEKIFDFQIGPAVASFLLLSALAHFLVSTVFYGWYIKNLANKSISPDGSNILLARP